MNNNEFIETCPEAVEMLDGHILTKQPIELTFSSNANFLFMREHIGEYLKEKRVKHEMHYVSKPADYLIKIKFK